MTAPRIPVLPCSHDGLGTAWRADPLFISRSNIDGRYYWAVYDSGARPGHRLYSLHLPSWGEAVKYFAERFGIILYPPGAEPSAESADPIAHPQFDEADGRPDPELTRIHRQENDR